MANKLWNAEKAHKIASFIATVPCVIIGVYLGLSTMKIMIITTIATMTAEKFFIYLDTRK